MTPILLLTLKLSVVAFLLAIGMLSTLNEINSLWRRPRLLLPSVLAMYVMVPLVTIIVVSILLLTRIEISHLCSGYFRRRTLTSQKINGNWF